MKEIDKLVQLSKTEIKKLIMGELVFIEHPKKGTCKVDLESVFIKII
jgi:hypothetical protein